MNTAPSIAPVFRMLILLVVATGAGCSSQRETTGPAPDAATSTMATQVRDAAVPLTSDTADYDALLELVGDAQVVLLGEATHGTHEFYRERARITQRLIREKGFTAVAVEADWPRAYRVNRYVRGIGDDPNAERALASFTEFPQWMWRNTDVRELAEWLRAHNQALPTGAREVGFYGLDLYSLGLSARVVIEYLERVDPAAAQRARERYACFARFHDDPAEYGAAVQKGGTSCQTQVEQQLQELQSRSVDPSDTEFFDVVQNARVVNGAEAYYRGMYNPAVSTWNLRDRHMAETLDALVQRTGRNAERAKVVVWEHNSHIGDARATQMGEEGELNLGQLARERYGDAAVLIGFTTYDGTVIAASQWGGTGERKTVRPALPESYENIFHATQLPSFFLPLRNGGSAATALAAPRLERAIGVIYLPRTERTSHYFYARLPEQFDAVIHWDQTRAVEPLR